MRTDTMNIEDVEDRCLPGADDYPPCKICDGPNDIGEVCAECAKDNDYFGADLEARGGWMIQSGGGR